MSYSATPPTLIYQSACLNPAGQRGFTLVEIAIVLIILGVLSRGAIAPIAAMIDHSNHRQTQKTLAHVRETLIGHVVATGALPCPLVESRMSENDQVGKCSESEGLVPAVVLGLTGAVSENGALQDAWGRPLRYVVSLSNHASRGDVSSPDWTTPGDASAVSASLLRSELSVCFVASANDCPRQMQRAGQLVAIIYSLGADASMEGEQSENQDGDSLYALSAPSIVQGQQFDDQLTWISRSEMSYWLLKSNWLP